MFQAYKARTLRYTMDLLEVWSYQHISRILAPALFHALLHFGHLLQFEWTRVEVEAAEVPQNTV